MEYSNEAVLIQLGKLESKMDEVLWLLRQSGRGVDSGSHGENLRQDDAARVILSGLTKKQHVALQMILAGKSNRDIAERLGVTENTAKVHVRSIAKKAGMRKRSQIVALFKKAFDDMEDDEYERLTGGITKNFWASGGVALD